MSRLLRFRGRLPMPLAALLAVAALHGTAWSLATQPLGGPDEISHVGYAQHLAETGHGPQRNGGDGTMSVGYIVLAGSLNLQPTQGHPESRPFWSEIDRVLLDIEDSPRDNGSGPNPAANYPPLYYSAAAVAYHVSPSRSLLGRAWAMRMVSVIALVAVVWLTWLIACELFAATWQRTAMTALVALQPKLGMMAGAVNPDLWLTAMAIAALLVALRIALNGPTARRSLVLGLVTAGGVLCHTRGIFLVPFAGLALLIGWLRFRPGLRDAATGALLTGAPAGVATGLMIWWGRAHASGAALGAESPVSGFNLREFVSYLWQFYLPKLSVMNPRVGPDYGYRQVWVDTLWGQYGSLDANLPPWVYDLLQIGMAAVALAALLLFARRFERVREAWAPAAVCAAFVLTLMGLLHVVSYQSLRGAAPGGGDPVLTGRYLFPLLPVLAALLVWLLGALPARLRPVAAGVTVGAASALALAAIALSGARFYA